MTEDKGISWISVILKLIIAGVVAFLLSLTIWIILEAIIIVPPSWIPLSSGLCGICFFFGTLYFIHTFDFKNWLYVLLTGFALCIATVILSIGLLLYQIKLPLIGNALNGVAFVIMIVASLGLGLWSTNTKITTPVTVTTSSKSTRLSIPKLGWSLSRPDLVAAVEVSGIPKDYIEKDRTIAGQFHSIVRHAILSDVPLGIRLERNRGKNRIFFLTWSKDQPTLDRQIHVLTDTLRANLSDFTFQTHRQYSGFQLPANISGAATLLTGIPLSLGNESQRIDALTLSAGVLQEMTDGMVQVFIVPAKVKKSDIVDLESSYKRATEESETVISKPRSGFFSHGEQESKTKINMKAKRKAESLSREIDRLSSKHMCRTIVSATCWDSDKGSAIRDSQRLVGVLMGALLPENKDVDFQMHSIKGVKDVAMLLKGIPKGPASLLTTEEAVAYFIFPQIDLGIGMTSREAFSTATRPAPESPPMKVSTKTTTGKTKVRWKLKSEKVYLGGLLKKNGEHIPDQFLWFNPSELDSHIGIFGNTRSGKTTTALSIIGQACRLGVHPVILVPSKPQDWRFLKIIFPDLRIFTAGDPDSAPLRYNLWNPPPNVPLSKWIKRIVQVFSAWLPNDRVITMHFDDVVHTMYSNCGWQTKGNKRGRPILLTDLVDAVKKVSQKLVYADEIKRNVYGALVARLGSLLRNYSLVDMYNTESGLTIPELLEHPTIIEMNILANDDKILLSGLLTAGISEYKMANPSPKLTNLLVLEEAHHLLSRHGDVSLEGPTIKQETVKGLVEMLRVAGGTGLGLVLIDQLPGSMVPEAVKLPVNVIIHALNDESERYLVGKHARCSDSQVEHISGMRKGEVIAYLEREDGPKNVQIFPLESYLTHKFRKEAFTTKLVKSKMRAIFEKHPHLCATQALPPDVLDTLTKAKSTLKKRTHTGPKNLALSTAENPRFLKLLSKNLDTSESAAINFVLKVASKSKGPEEDEREVAERILQHAQGVLTDPTYIERTEKLLVRLQEESTA